MISHNIILLRFGAQPGAGPRVGSGALAAWPERVFSTGQRRTASAEARQTGGQFLVYAPSLNKSAKKSSRPKNGDELAVQNRQYYPSALGLTPKGRPQKRTAAPAMHGGMLTALDFAHPSAVGKSEVHK